MIIKPFLWVIIFIATLGTNLFGWEDGPKTEVPWDTVTAQLQIIESFRQPDSVKTSLTKELFIQYGLTEQDYRSFYDDFLNQPVKKQREFLDKVKAILQSLMKKNVTQPQTK